MRVQRRQSVYCVSHAVCVTHLLHEDEHCFSVLLPLMHQLILMRELITSQEYRQLKTVCVQIAEIIHTWRGENTHINLRACTTHIVHQGVL